MWLRKIDQFSFLFQWLGSDPNYDCTIRVANLDLRDSGKWVCEIGSSTKESFQVQTKEFVIDIESECCGCYHFGSFFIVFGSKIPSSSVASICAELLSKLGREWKWKIDKPIYVLANIFYSKSNCVLNSNYLIQVLLTNDLAPKKLCKLHFGGGQTPRHFD